MKIRKKKPKNQFTQIDVCEILEEVISEANSSEQRKPVSPKKKSEKRRKPLGK